MFLKRVEIQGFKSFADRVTIELGTGITAIVGPNGSGKSNLADAVRWALGENNPRQLRGQRGEDLIFSGSESRRGLSMAEVSLTFDNADNVLPLDYSEVTVSRRAYRDGSGEYFINRSPCRLRDIQELFFDTGVARDGYSLIGQGTADAIVSARPEERRSLLEEAAGIVRAKHQKKEALARLEASSRDAQRVADIMAELQLQLDPLREEAARAEEWLGYRRTRDRLALTLAWRERERILVAWRQAREAAAVAKAEVETAQQRLASLEDEWSRLREEQEREQVVWQQLQEELLVLANRVAAADREVSKWEERKAGGEGELARLRAEEGRLEALWQEAVERATRAREELAAWQAESGGEHRRLQDEEEQLKAEQERWQSAQAEIENLKAEFIDLVQKLASVRNRLAAGEAEVRGGEEQVARYTTREQGMRQTLERLEADMGVLATQIEESRRRQSELRRQLEEAGRELCETQRRGQEAEGHLRAAQDRLRTVSSRREALQDLQEGYEGYARGPRALLQVRRERPGLFPGLIGPVSELLGVPEELETALEVALGSSLQDMVVRTAEDGQKAIGYLKATRSGWATFLPLDSLRPSRLGGSERLPLRGEGLLGVAAELVSYLPEHRPVVEFLLGRTVIARDLPAALAYARATGFRVKVVTLEGEVVFSGGSMAGGYRSAPRSGLLRRNRELAELEAQVKEATENVASLEQEASQCRQAREAAQERISQLEAELRQTELYHVGLQGEWESRQREQEKVRQELAAVELEAGSAGEALRGRQEEVARLREQVEQLQREQYAVAAEVEEKTAALAGQQLQLKEKEERVVALKVALAGRQEMGARLQEARQQAEQGLAALADQREELGRHIRERAGVLQEATIELERWRQEWQDLRGQRQQKQEELDRCTGESQRLARRAAAVERLRRQAEKELVASKEEGHALELEAARLQGQLREVEGRLQTRFAPDSAAEAVSPEVAIEEWAEEDDDVLRERMEEMTGRMAALEPVNLSAPQECARLEERYGFLAGQHRDLEEASADLKRIIAQLDREMAEKMRCTFEEVREKFRRFFTEIFGGGKADLVLTDPADPLNAGLDLVAQPPGKKLQPLSLLSGGERTLCAIALLFALLQTRPGRFCLFDEIDANLDEVNVGRFAAFLRELATGGQFLVVTHQKGTMEVADVLYGTSMEESGVTRVVSLRLAEATA